MTTPTPQQNAAILKWEPVAQDRADQYNLVNRTTRAKVPGGWLVAVSVGTGGGITFYPDPNHE